jgi:cytoplasmic iron level regulating protein YaaA (DUF328/UPF0246 family)
VLILLPPSEAKRPGGRGPSLSSSVPGDDAISAARPAVLAALVDFCGGDADGAARALALPARSAAADLATNVAVGNSPTMPALDRYAGTVYEGLDARTLTPAARRRALDSILIFSGLFGVSRADEPVPAYRLPVSATVPGIGALTPYWRERLPGPLTELIGADLVVDLRSTDYAGMWRPAGDQREQLITVRILNTLPSGALSVVSYPSKHGKGRLARALVSSRKRITTAAHVVDAWLTAGGVDAVVLPGRLDLIGGPSSLLASR